MRVLHVLVSMAADAGGPASSVQRLVTALAAQGVQCEVATTVGGRCKAAPLSTPPGVPVHIFSVSPLARFWNGHSRGISRFLSGNAARFDVIHVHELWHYPGYSAWRAAHRNHVATVQSICGCLVAKALASKPVRKRIYMRFVQRRYLNSASAVHALTPVESKEVAAQSITAPLFQAPNGIDEEFIEDLATARPDELLRCHPQLRGKRVILFLSRMVAGKGPLFLARSFRDVASRFPDAALLFVGPPEDARTLSKVHQVLADAELLHRVAFAGMLTGQAKLAAFKLARMFVLPSQADALPNAVIEAMAAGLPVVVSEQCNFPEVAARDAGFVLPLDNAAFGRAITSLLQDDLRCDEMGMNARRLAEERFTWRDIARSFAELYRRAANGEATGSQ